MWERTPLNLIFNNIRPNILNTEWFFCQPIDWKSRHTKMGHSSIRQLWEYKTSVITKYCWKWLKVICDSQMNLYNTLEPIVNARKSDQSKCDISLWVKIAEFPWRIVGLQLCGFVQGLVNAWTVQWRPLQRKQLKRSVGNNGRALYNLRP